jgi:hypothetical protein
VTGFARTREPRLACKPPLRNRVLRPEHLHSDLALTVGGAVDDAGRPLSEHGPEPIAADAIHGAIIPAG